MNYTSTSRVAISAFKSANDRFAPSYLEGIGYFLGKDVKVALIW